MDTEKEVIVEKHENEKNEKNIQLSQTSDTCTVSGNTAEDDTSKDELKSKVIQPLNTNAKDKNEEIKIVNNSETSNGTIDKKDKIITSNAENGNNENKKVIKTLEDKVNESNDVGNGEKDDIVDKSRTENNDCDVKGEIENTTEDNKNIVKDETIVKEEKVVDTIEKDNIEENEKSKVNETEIPEKNEIDQTDKTESDTVPKESDTNSLVQQKNGENPTKSPEKNCLSLSEIDSINDAIQKKRVDGLQTLFKICFNARGKANEVKERLLSFSGLKLDPESKEYKKKAESILRSDIKTLKTVCDVLCLNKNGGKAEIAERIIEFLNEPNEDYLNEADDELANEPDDEDKDETIKEEKKTKEDVSPKKRKRSNYGDNATTRRPRRATAGRTRVDSSYVEYSSSDEFERHKNHSDSGSDYKPSGFNSDSDSKRGSKKKLKRMPIRARVSGRRNKKKMSESEEEDSITSEEESDDMPKRRRREPVSGRQLRVGTRARRAKKSKLTDLSETEEDEEEEEDDDEEEEEELEASEAGSEETDSESKAKSGRNTTLRNNKTNNKPTKALSPEKEKTQKNIKSKANESEEEAKEAESEDDEPLAKKTKVPIAPTDDDIKSYIKEILDKANLEEITMKTVCKKVYAKYPDHDLTDKKDFIKATVKSLISA